MAEVMIPPWVRPESPETIRIIDDATIAFPPAFGRGTTQRGIWADPRWGLRRRYRGLRSDEKASILNALNETRGQFNVLRVTPHTPLRGSFSTGELLTNNTFASGTTGWSVTGEYTLTSSDRVLRAVRTATTAVQAIQPSAATVVQYAPYCLRAFVKVGRGSYSNLYVQDNTTGALSNPLSSSSGLLSLGFVPSSTTAAVRVLDNQSSNLLAGDYFEVQYTSLAKCALVDNGQNLLLRSDEIDSAGVWTGLTGASIFGNVSTAPNGSTVADDLIEDTSNGFHRVFQAVSGLSSSAADYCFTVALKARTRTWAQLIIQENTGGTNAGMYFQLSSSGATGTATTGANWANVRAFIQDMGNGWYQCTVIGRKTNAATQLTGLIFAATANNTASYTGDGASGLRIWRATLSPSSVPVRLVQTTSSSTTGTTQTGGALHTKGWPASTNGLLLTGDWVEINGELKQLTAPVNSDASGLAYMQFRPSLAGSPADSDPIVVQEPFGRFIYPQGTRELSNLFGVYSDCEMDLEEIYV